MASRRISKIVLDGGMGHQLKKMGVEIQGPVGSMQRFLGVAQANMNQPHLVRDAHLSYIDAGCDVITTNNYAVVPAALKGCEDYKGAEDVRRLVQAAGDAAKAAQAARPHKDVKIAGCLPPLKETYRTDRVGSLDENLGHYRLIANSIAPYADVLLCETMSTANEALAATLAAAEADKPVWVSWTLDEDSPVLRSGETLGQALEALGPLLLGRVEAFLFNCTSPEVITKAIPLLLKEPLLPAGTMVGGYANGFITAKSGTGEYRDLSPDEYWQSFVSKWVEGSEKDAATLGAQLAERGVVVGGCCGIFPQHIQRIRDGIDAMSAHDRAQELRRLNQSGKLSLANA